MSRQEDSQIITISNRIIGPNHPCLIIGEVSQNHDGSLGQAHAYIDAIANAGADAVKFQTHIAAAESTPSEPWRIKFSQQDKTRYDYWKRMEFTEAHWQGLKDHAEESGLIFLSSPFSTKAVELLEEIGICAWKVASGEITNSLLLDQVAMTGKPVLLSSGMSHIAELDTAVNRVRELGSPVAVFQCTSAYPCPPEKIGVNILSVFRDRYECPVGLSDHSGSIYPGLAGVTLGLNMIEVHVTLSREMFGPDVLSSVTSDELHNLVDGIRFIERMLNNPVDKDQIAHEMSSLRNIFTKSIVARENLEAGTILDEKHLILKKPGSGFPASELQQLIGRRLKRNVNIDALLTEEDLGEEDGE